MPSLRSAAIFASQQPTAPIGFLYLQLPPPPCAVLLVGTCSRWTDRQPANQNQQIRRSLWVLRFLLQWKCPQLPAQVTSPLHHGGTVLCQWELISSHLFTFHPVQHSYGFYEVILPLRKSCKGHCSEWPQIHRLHWSTARCRLWHLWEHNKLAAGARFKRAWACGHLRPKEWNKMM